MSMVNFVVIIFVSPVFYWQGGTMTIYQTDRRAFLCSLASLSLMPLLAACRSEAQTADDTVLKQLRSNAVTDHPDKWWGACDAPDGVGSTANLVLKGDTGQRLRISGTVYRFDGKTPAANTLIYLYHTDTEGIYGRANQHHHGKYRAWLLTGSDGKYSFETIKPAPYPGNREAAHIHMTITTLESKEDWIDSILFDDDRLITQRQRREAGNKGGFFPIVTLRKNAEGVLTAQRDIKLLT